MSAHRAHAHLDAPLEAVGSLVGTPSPYPEWWPRVIEVRGERFEEGDEYAQVTKDPIGTDPERLPARATRRPARDPDQLSPDRPVRRTGSSRRPRAARSSRWRWASEARRLGHRIFDRARARATSAAGRTSRSTASAKRLVGRLLRRAELDGAWDVPPVVAAVRLEHLRGLPVDDLHPAGEEPHTSTAATGISHAARTLARVHISSNAGVSAAHLSAASHAEPRSRQSRQRSSHTPPLQWRDQRGAGWSGSGTTFGFGIPFARR